MGNRNIIWCLPDEMPVGYYNTPHLAEIIKDLEDGSSTKEVLVWKPQNNGPTGVRMHPFAVIPAGVPTNELINTRPHGY